MNTLTVPSQQLSVATLNIWNRSEPWLKRLALIRGELAEQRPGILGLQEVVRFSDGTTTIDQAIEISEALGYYTCFGAAHDLGAGLSLGNALLSRFPILEHHSVPLPGGRSVEFDSAVLCVALDVWGVVVWVFVTHLTWKLHHGAIRLRQIDRLVAEIKARAPIAEVEYPPILLGDFNAEPDSDEIRFLTGRATRDDRSVFFADSWHYGDGDGPGYTFDRRNPYAAQAHEPPRRIDYIFVRGPDRRFRGEPLKTRIVFAKPSVVDGEAVWPSDHFGLLTLLSFS